MPELVLNDDGSAKVEDGKIVMKGDDGNEFSYDVVDGYAQLKSTRSEAATYRTKLRAAEKIVESFGDLDPNEARQAVTTVTDLKGKHKSELETLKTEMETGYQAQLTKRDEEITGLRGQIYKYRVTDQFHRSEVAKSLVFPPDIAAKVFDEYFEVNEDGELIGKLNGQMIHSQEKPGNPAGFEEALSAMINARPDKDAILKPTGAQGSGTPPGPGGSSRHGMAPGAQKTGKDKIKDGISKLL